MNKSASENQNRLIGQWRSKTRSTEWGRSTVLLEFRTDHGFRAVTTFMETGGDLEVEGQYEVKGDTLVRDVVHKGKPVLYRIDGDILIIKPQSGPTERYYRQ